MLIALTKGQLAIVDDEYFPEISKHTWCAIYNPCTKSFYAKRGAPREGGKRGTIIMHREIVQAKPGEQIDHGNHNTLDNRRGNLNITTHSGNRLNTRMQRNNESGVCGVNWCKRSKMWVARIAVGGKRKHIGYYAKIVDAIAAREAANSQYGYHENHGKAFVKDDQWVFHKVV